MPATEVKSRRMFAGALLIWGVAIHPQTIVLAEQEKVYLLYAFQGAAVYYGLLGILAVLPWKTWIASVSCTPRGAAACDSCRATARN